jgi:hypothetical protein
VVQNVVRYRVFFWDCFFGRIQLHRRNATNLISKKTSFHWFFLVTSSNNRRGGTNVYAIRVPVFKSRFTLKHVQRQIFPTFHHRTHEKATYRTWSMSRHYLYLHHIHAIENHLADAKAMFHLIGPRRFYSCRWRLIYSYNQSKSCYQCTYYCMEVNKFVYGSTIIKNGELSLCKSSFPFSM